MSPLPGVRTLDHVGLTVPDLAAARRFFVEVLGFSMLRLGTLNLELFEFEAADQRREVPRTSDWGGAHLAFYVDDLPAAVAHLREHGARVLGEPMALPGIEAGQGNQFVFALAPGGVPFELISYPSGKAYEKDGGPRLFDPRREPPWEGSGG
ncbi:MAG TPA: VOC family protein [Solirubrobacterales bacterium]|jgi:glyoxylase I family protein